MRGLIIFSKVLNGSLPLISHNSQLKGLKHPSKVLKDGLLSVSEQIDKWEGLNRSSMVLLWYLTPHLSCNSLLGSKLRGLVTYFKLLADCLTLSLLKKYGLE